MASKRDYYEVLGVSKGATEDEIKRAYRRLAKECHPDLHPNDKNAEERFKELNEANEVLSNKDKRARYDQFGFDAPGMGGMGGAADFSGFGDIFDQLFGGMSGMGGMGGARRSGAQAGSDLRYDLRITFEESYTGCDKSFEFSRSENCDLCRGSGAKPGTTPQTCPTCKGAGQVRTAGGFMTMVRTCSTCGGTGKYVQEKCSACAGTGRTRKRREVKVKIPAGIASGQSIVLGGEGEPGRNGGPSGDLYVQVTVKPHRLFRRDGSTLYLDLPISFTQAALGADVDVPTMAGTVKHHIPEGTQTQTEFRLRGSGMPILRSTGKGDLIVRVTVEIPKKLSERQKELLRQFDDASTGREYEGRKSFFEKMKDLFG